MESQFKIYNSLTRKLEVFEALNPPNVGMYVCGPTVYGDPHLGHARPAIIFDVLFRYLKYLGYKVRYVRNITDVGHLENDADEGEDKIGKKARLEQLEPMEVVQFYTVRYHDFMQLLNVTRPSIEPTASGHIIEQLAIVEKIMEKGYAYESNGSVYFDVEKYSREHNYGVLSGRVLEELHSTTRELEGQKEKRNSFDFALWKKADPLHIMRWPSAYSEGFPGWHLECTAMSARYLGETFDIHGGGMDLLFPHHECEIAQSTIAYGQGPARYWMHNNMITINGQKMGKSLDNFITLEELFSGDHTLLDKAWTPMTVRFFILQAHYRSTVDFSNEALLAAEKGLQRLMEGIRNIDKVPAAETNILDLKEFRNKCFEALNDDLNTPVLLSHLFEGVRAINMAVAGKGGFTTEGRQELKVLMEDLVFNVLGLMPEQKNEIQSEVLTEIIDLILQLRQEAKINKDWNTADKIRNDLAALGIVVKDGKEGVEWEFAAKS